ncbi:MAG: GtrA family protein [bacterium]|nr:GtrA family protein [bacterium]MDZ4248075.1 GtrA family protein [Patescibacteria group bacterium]
MNLSIAAIRRDKHARQFVKFVLVGLTTTAINFTVYGLLLIVGVYYLTAAVISFSVATLNSYTWNRIWTFRAGRHHIGKLAKFTVVQLLGLSFNLIGLWLLVEYAGLHEFPAQVLANGVVVMSNFVGNKFWTFRA